MNRARRLLTTVLLAGVLLLLVPAGSASAQSHLPPDGNLHAWTGYDRTGTHCAWAGPSGHWGVCRNTASSLENAGYPHAYENVNVYWGTNYTGAWTCIIRGGYWYDLRNRMFHLGAPGTPGRHELLDNNISSHRWVNQCG
jgi:hypothetical protein